MMQVPICVIDKRLLSNNGVFETTKNTEIQNNNKLTDYNMIYNINFLVYFVV